MLIEMLIAQSISNGSLPDTQQIESLLTDVQCDFDILSDFIDEAISPPIEALIEVNASHITILDNGFASKLAR